MKKYLFLLLLPVFIFGFRSSTMVGVHAGSGGSTAASYGGDVIKETFEASGYDEGTCGTAPCWTETGSPNEDYALSGLSGGTGDAKNGSYGMRIDSTGTVLKSTASFSGNPSTLWVEFSFYLDSENMNNGNENFTFSTSDSFGYLRIWDDTGVSGDIRVWFSTTGSSSNDWAISLDTWYYVAVYMDDAALDCTIKVGTTYGGTETSGGTDTFECSDVTTTVDEAYIGADGNKQVGLVFGYFHLDDDGTFDS